MADDFSDGWIEFQLLVDQLKAKHNLSQKDIDEYFKMYKDDQEEGSE